MFGKMANCRKCGKFIDEGPSFGTTVSSPNRLCNTCSLKEPTQKTQINNVGVRQCPGCGKRHGPLSQGCDCHVRYRASF